MKRPDLTNWRQYDPERPPEADRHVLVRIGYDNGDESFVSVTVRIKKAGFILDSNGYHFWSDFRGAATHWIYIDEIIM